MESMESSPWNEYGFHIGLAEFSDKVTFHMEWYGIVHGFHSHSPYFSHFSRV